MSEIVDAIPEVVNDPPPAWTTWILFALALGSCVVAGLIYVWALRAGGVSGLSAGEGGWWPMYDVASKHRATAMLLLWSGTMLAFGATLGALGAVLGRGTNRIGGALVLAISIWVLGSASLAFMRWRDVDDPPERRSPPPVQVQ